MTVTLDLPTEMENELSAEAARLGLPLREYILRLLSGTLKPNNKPKTGAELVEYWRNEGLIGARPDIADSQTHAREIRNNTGRRWTCLAIAAMLSITIATAVAQTRPAKPQPAEGRAAASTVARTDAPENPAPYVSQPAKPPRFQIRLVAKDNDTSPVEEMTLRVERTRGGRAERLRVLREILFDESDVASATIHWTQDGRPEVMVKLSATAKRSERLADIKERPRLAVVYGGELMGRPGAYSGIPNWVSIDGIQTEAEAKAIVEVLTAGARSQHPTQPAAGASSATSPERVAQIIRAAYSGDLDRIKELLDADPALLNATMPDGEKALHAAVMGGSKEAVELLLSKGANISDPGYFSPVILAVSYNRKDMVEFLIAKGADPNSAGGAAVGWGPLRPTPLQRAAASGNKQMVEVLVAHGADINAKSQHGDTALLGALMEGRRDTAEFLVTKGAKVDILAASGLGRVEQVVAFLKVQPDLAKTTGPMGLTPLHVAAINGENRVVHLLLANGADINAGDKAAFTALHVAASQGQIDTIALLLTKGADINARDANGWTPLHTAARCGQRAVVELLLSRGADASIKSDYGETALDVANWNTMDILRTHTSSGGTKDTRPQDSATTTAKGSEVRPDSRPRSYAFSRIPPLR